MRGFPGSAARRSPCYISTRPGCSASTFNDLRCLPGLTFEGQWDNHPRQTRLTLLDMLSHLPQDTWWSLNSLVSAIREKMPDFQRPGGDYDSWFIRKEGSDTC